MITCTLISLFHQIRRFSPKYPIAVLCSPCNATHLFGYDVTYANPDTLEWGHRLCLIRWVCSPIAFKQLRNPIVGMVPIVMALAPLIRSTLDYLWSGRFHCNEAGQQYWDSPLTVLSKLTNSIILFVHLPCTQLSLCLSIFVGIQDKRVLVRS